MAEQTEKAFLKQPKVFLCSKKSGKGKAPGKGGNRYFKSIGLGFKTPREATEVQLKHDYEEEEEYTVVDSRRVQRRARRTQASSSAARDASVGETSSFLDPRIEAIISRSIQENFERCEQAMMNRIDDYYRTLSQELVSRCEELLDRSSRSRQYSSYYDHEEELRPFQSGYSWHAQATQWPRWDEPAPQTSTQNQATQWPRWNEPAP